MRALRLFAFLCIKARWSWGESNPCPNIFLKSFLHAYPVLFPGYPGSETQMETDNLLNS